MSSNSSMRPSGSAPSENRSSCSCSAVKVSVEVPECSYPGCKRPVYNDGKSWASNGRVDNAKRAFCGLFHRDLYFSDLLERKKRPSAAVEGRPSTSRARTDTDTDAGLGIIPKCMLQECSRDVCMDSDSGLHFDFCTKRHMLAMRPFLVRRWSLEGTLCKLGDCVRHVWVEDDGRPYDFCSMSHATLAAARRGLPVSGNPETSAAVRVEAPVVPAAGQLTNERHEQIIQKTSHDNDGYYTQLSPDEMHRLLNGNLDGGPVVRQGIDIYRSHPWELVDRDKGKTRYFLHRVSQDSQKTSRFAKDGYAWKQSGPSHRNEPLATKYFKYQQHSRGKRKKGDEKNGSDPTWNMREVTLLNESNSSKLNRTVLWRICVKDPCQNLRKKPSRKLAVDIPGTKSRKGGDSNPLAMTQRRGQDFGLPGDSSRNSEGPEPVLLQTLDIFDTKIDGGDGPLDDTKLEETIPCALVESEASGQLPWDENSIMPTLELFDNLSSDTGDSDPLINLWVT